MQESKEWLSTEEAADCWNALVEETRGGAIRIDVSAQKFRRLCREGRLSSAGIEVIETTRGSPGLASPARTHPPPRPWTAP